MKKSLLALCLFLAGGACLEAASLRKEERVKNFARMDLADTRTSSDKFEVDQKSGWMTMTGHATVQNGDNLLTADKIRLNSETGEAQATGHVKLSQGKVASWEGEYIEVNFKTGAAMATTGLFHSHDFRILASEVRRNPDGRYEGRHVRVTTCTNDVDHWHWCLAGNGSFRDNDSVELWNCVPYLFGIPCGYVPWGYRDLDAHYGLRSMPGYSSRWGAFLLNTYSYNLYHAPHSSHAKLDAATQFDYRTKRGVAAGETFSWDLGEAGHGFISGYYINDIDKPDDWENRNWYSPIHRDRYIFQIEHQADLSPRDQVLIHASYLSDSEVAREFNTRSARLDSTPMNYLSYEHRENTWAAGLGASGPVNEFYGGTDRLPEGWLNVVPLSLWDSGFNYESQTRGGYLMRQYGELENADLAYRYDPGPWADFETLRFDTAHRVTYPVKIGDALSIVPRAGYRGTYYTSGDGRRDVYREYADLGTEASMRFVGDWSERRRHVMEPYLDYTYQPEWDNLHGDDRAYMFDRYDRTYDWLELYGRDGAWVPYEWQGFRPGYRNLIQDYDDELKTYRTIIDWDLYAVYQIQSDGPMQGDGPRLAGTKLIYSPTKRLDIRGTTDWDTENDQIAYTDISAFYKLTEHFRLGGGYLKRAHDVYDYGPIMNDEWSSSDKELIYGGFTHIINETWSWSLYARQDLHENALDEVGGWVQYSLDCLSFQLRAAYWPTYERDDGTDRDSDTRVMFLVWLNAIGHEPKDDWLRW